mgnify:CR=1 FL=1
MNFKKFLAVLMTAVMAMCAMVVPAFAAVNPTAPRQETSSTTTNVTASVNSNCTIVIPESITLTKADNVAGSGEYT